MSAFLLIATIVLVFVVIFQIAKASEYVGVLKGEEKSREHDNRINGFLMIAFLVLGLIGAYWCNELFYKKTLLAWPSASVEGEDIDTMLWITLGITGAVWFLTQILLFYFAWRYQEKPGRKAEHISHNNTLEFVWTAVPAIALLILVVFGLKYWFKITGDPPSKGLITVEITGQQFKWTYRYPGKDGVFGKTYFKDVDEGKMNPLGQIWSDSANMDDIVESTELHVPVGHPVKLIIHSKDVIHDVGLAWFRMKMDAVPGIPTTLWFTPRFTTQQMRDSTGNPDFVYEISCDQLCGQGHFGMRGILTVDSEADYYKWLNAQTPNYYAAFPDKKPQAAGAAQPPATAPATTAKPDSTAKAAVAARIKVKNS